MYPGHGVVLHFSSLFRRSLIWTGLTLIQLLPVRGIGSGKGEGIEEGRTNRASVYGLLSSFLMPLSDSMHQTLTSTACEERTIVLSVTMPLTLRTPCKSLQEGFSAEERS